MNKGQKLWDKAKKVIPGGSMLLSKRAEMHLPNQWPSYFSKADGCRVWDLDGREYIDMYLMGVGTNTLGYAHPEIDNAVIKAIKDSNMSTLNCPEEVLMAEKLLSVHPWSKKARFARSGGEACSIAIRIARAFSGKDNIAFCGYHGWQDWYLSANLSNSNNLSEHLLPGLSVKGVPKDLKKTAFPFRYNNFKELEKIVNKEDVGVICMEVVRNEEPIDDFLIRVRELAKNKGIVLIFDECTSGFRQNFGGIHQDYKVEPDIAIFGKAIGNGYALTAVVGKEDIMDEANNTFISSTFWSEKIGFIAGLKTLEIMERESSWKKIPRLGRKIKEDWEKLAKKHDLSIDLFGIDSLPSFSFRSENNQAYKTLITQEMLKQGYLAGTSVYVSTEHSEEIVNSYFNKLDPVFQQIRKCEDGLDVMNLLEGPVAHKTFERLN
jgi:glutamate-1-semialdehyde 2,1-aminomutase